MARDLSNADFADEEGVPEEELVAYLDGELDDEAHRRIEARLACDPAARETLRRLEATWDMLEELGRAQVSESFTQTTMEMVAVAAVEDVQQAQAEIPRRNRRRWLLGSAAILLSAAAGFFLAAWWWPDPNQQLLRDLPVLENLDAYQQVGDVDFLRKLYTEDRRQRLFPREDGRGS